MFELTQTQYRSAKDCAVHDHGCTVTYGATANGSLLTITHRKATSPHHTWGLQPWLTSLTHQDGTRVCAIHNTAAHAEVVEAAMVATGDNIT